MQKNWDVIGDRCQIVVWNLIHLPLYCGYITVPSVHGDYYICSIYSYAPWKLLDSYYLRVQGAYKFGFIDVLGHIMHVSDSHVNFSFLL